MTEEEKQAIEDLKNIVDDLEDAEDGAIISLQQDEIDSLKILAELIENKQKEIQELKKVIKMVEIYKAYGIPEDVEMVIMRKDDLLNNTNNEFISKDKIKEKLDQIYEEYQKILSSNGNLQEKNIATFQYNAMRTVLEELLGE